MEPIKETAAKLLQIIWRGIPPDYKSRYRMTIWEQFENQVKAAAYTSNLAKFVSSICGKLSASLGMTADERQAAEQILNSGYDRELLKLLREETTLLVLMVRVAIQERRDDWKLTHPEEEE